jgi:hypothetical protein
MLVAADEGVFCGDYTNGSIAAYDYYGIYAKVTKNCNDFV